MKIERQLMERGGLLELSVRALLLNYQGIQNSMDDIRLHYASGLGNDMYDFGMKDGICISNLYR